MFGNTTKAKPVENGPVEGYAVEVNRVLARIQEAGALLEQALTGNASANSGENSGENDQELIVCPLDKIGVAYEELVYLVRTAKAACNADDSQLNGHRLTVLSDFKTALLDVYRKIQKAHALRPLEQLGASSKIHPYYDFMPAPKLIEHEEYIRLKSFLGEQMVNSLASAFVIHFESEQLYASAGEAVRAARAYVKEVSQDRLDMATQSTDRRGGIVLQLTGTFANRSLGYWAARDELLNQSRRGDMALVTNSAIGIFTRLADKEARHELARSLGRLVADALIDADQWEIEQEELRQSALLAAEIELELSSTESGPATRSRLNPVTGLRLPAGTLFEGRPDQGALSVERPSQGALSVERPIQGVLSDREDV